MNRGYCPATPIPSTARRNQPSLATFAFFQVGLDLNICLEFTFDALCHAVRGLCRIDGHVKIEFDELDVCHQRKRCGLFFEAAIHEGMIGRDHSAHNGIDRILHGNVGGGIGADQQAVDRESGRFHRWRCRATALVDVQAILHHALMHSLG